MNATPPITICHDGVTIISCCRYYEGNNREITKGMKSGEHDAIVIAAERMAHRVPSNAVLVPMPGRTGFATYTYDLAEEISKLTGAPVVDAIQGNARESMYDVKHRGKILSEKELGFRQTSQIKEGYIPYVVENVVDTGRTAKAAAHSIKGNSVILSYSMSDTLMDDVQKTNEILHRIKR